jgi:hypothetical protein
MDKLRIKNFFDYDEKTKIDVINFLKVDYLKEIKQKAFMYKYKGEELKEYFLQSFDEDIKFFTEQELYEYSFVINKIKEEMLNEWN